MKQSKGFQAVLTLIVLAFIIAGCGKGTGTAEPTSQPSAASPTSEATKAAETAGTQETVTVKMLIGAKSASTDHWKQLAEATFQNTGIKLELVPIPGNDDAEIQKKLDVMLLSGDESDLFVIPNPTGYMKYVNGGFIRPLNDIAAKIGLDIEGVYGKYLTKDEQGVTYGLPYNVSKWLVFYNKKVFDDAKVPYPDSNVAWTWSEYIETAKKLTSGEGKTKIYGSYMLDYDNYLYMQARQKNVPSYKADGTLNYDDPAFKESLKFFNDLGAVHKIQPGWLEFKTQKLAWDGFMSGKYGMHIIADWYAGLLTDAKSYPRDWQVGIAPLPHPDDADAWFNFGVTANYVMNKNSKHPEEALKVMNYLASEGYKITNNVPARVDWSAEDRAKFYEETSQALNGEITTQDFANVLSRDDEGFTDEKIMGVASSQITNIISKEADLYLTGQRSLDDTVASILKLGNQAIEEEKARQQK